MTEIIKISRSAHGNKFHFCFPTRIWQVVLTTGTERIKNNLEIWHRCIAFLPQCAKCVPLQLGMLKYDYTVLKPNKFIYISVRELKSIVIIVSDRSDEKMEIKIKGKSDKKSPAAQMKALSLMAAKEWIITEVCQGTKVWKSWNLNGVSTFLTLQHRLTPTHVLASCEMQH